MTKCIEVKDIKIGEGIPKICVPIVGRTITEIFAQAKKIAAKSPDLIEWRGDFFEDIMDFTKVVEVMAVITEKIAPIPLIFTFRTKGEGGERAIATTDYTDLNLYVAKKGLADFIDVEIFFDESKSGELIAAIQREGKHVVASNHHFDKTPSQPEIIKILQKMDDLNADILKIAVMPNVVADPEILQDTTIKMKAQTIKPLIAIAMGELGMPTRIAGEVFGSAVTFACVDEGSAPGQIEIDELRKYLNDVHERLQNDLAESSLFKIE